MLRDLQKTVNQCLSQLIYRARLDDGRLEVLGPKTIVRNANGAISLRVSVAITSYESSRKLERPAASAENNASRRVSRCLKKQACSTCPRDSPGLAGVSLDRLAFDVMYVRSASYL